MMFRTHALAAMMTASLVAGPMLGCEDLPGDPGTQGAVLGGAGGAAAGAAVAGEDNRLMGALIGGVLGGGGGYLIGANSDKWMDNQDESRDEAQQAVEEAREDPATAEEVRNAETADLNDDGFVTMDEVIAMADAGLSEQEMLDRLDRTGQIFELNEQQRQRLVSNGVSPYIVDRMQRLNQQERRRVVQAEQRRERQEREVIGRPRGNRRGTQNPPRPRQPREPMNQSYDR